MQSFHWFSFPVTTLSLVRFQYFKHDNVSMPKTFMHAHSGMMTFLHLKYIMADANFPLIQFSKFSDGSVFPVTTP